MKRVIPIMMKQGTPCHIPHKEFKIVIKHRFKNIIDEKIPNLWSFKSLAFSKK